MTTPEVPQEPVYVVGPRGPKGDPGDGAGLSAEAVSALIATALAELPPSGLTQNQVEAIVNSALSVLPPSGLTSAAVQALIATALESVETTSQVNAAIANAIAALPVDEVTSVTQINDAIASALASYENTAAVTAAINAALLPYESASQITAAISAALSGYYTSEQVDAAIAAAVAGIPAPGLDQAALDEVLAAALAPYALTTDVHAAISAAVLQAISALPADAITTAGQVQAIVDAALAGYSLTRAQLEAILYDTTHSWELVPGTDVPATCVGVLPKIGTDTGYDYYAGLVTVEAGVLPAASQIGEAWLLRPATTALTTAALDASSGPGSEQAYAAGVWLAYYSCPSTSQPPYAFPEGWTPGNTTGSGPVLPYLGLDADGHWPIYAGLVEYVAPGLPGQETSDGTWYLAPVDTPLTYAGANAGAGDSPASTDAPQVWMAVYYPSSSGGAAPFGPPPTALPAGWTFRPYGLGPVAITDENAGGLIGDVAYVVSGYVYNSRLSQEESYPLALADPRYIGQAVVGVDYAQGDLLTLSNQPGKAFKVSIGPCKFTAFYADGAIGSAYGYAWPYQAPRPLVADAMGDDYCWPFIERFDLAAKKWLPRIPMPMVDTMFFPWGNDVGYDIGYTASYEGVNYVSLTQNAGVVPPDSPGDWQVQPPLPPAVYASEGGIAGVIDGKLYFGGGDGDNITGQEFFVYDPADDSITRLADMAVDPAFALEFPDALTDFPDYSSYGVLDGKVWWFEEPAVAHRYDPVSAEWTYHRVTGADLPGDQIQGFEIDGKLWFTYSGAVFVFDPQALTVTAKALRSGGPVLNEGAVFLVDGKLRLYGGEVGVPAAAEYDPVLDAWIDLHDIAAPIVQKYPSGAETFNVTYNGIPYALTGVENVTNSGVQVGVRGLTGVGYDRPRPARVQDRMDDSLGTLVLIAADHTGWNEETIALPLQNGATATVTMHAVTNAGYNDCVYHFRVAGRPDLVADVIISRFVPVAGGYVINTYLTGEALPLDGSQRLPDAVTFPVDGPYSFSVSLHNVRRRA